MIIPIRNITVPIIYSPRPSLILYILYLQVFFHVTSSIFFRCRKYEYELLPEMQEKVMTAALAAAGLTAETEHTQVKIGFTCPKETSDLNLFVNMTKLNGIQIDAMNLMTENEIQKVTMTLDGKITDVGMRCLLCQIGKEAEEFRILELFGI